MWPMWDIFSGTGWWMIFGGIWMILFWGAVIFLIVWAVKKLAGKGDTSARKTALDIAKERYARGEITEEEFSRIKNNLS